jgi:ribosomal protein L24E
MSDKDKKHFRSSKTLVPVHSLLPEIRPGAGSVLVMKDGSFRSIIRTGAVNFDMKSRTEQSGLTWSFGALANSLEPDFPIEIVSHSKMLDTEAYARQFQGRLRNDNTPEGIKSLIREHIAHFENTVKSNRLLQREIYIVVPWKGVRGPVQKNVLDDVPLAPLFRALSRKAESMTLENQKPTDLEISTARQQLEIRVDQVLSRMQQQMGVWGYALNEDDVRQLLYSLFHPSLTERQRKPGEDTGGVVYGFSAQGLPGGRG